MKRVGIRALKQNASAVVAEAAAGEVIEITDRGRPVARIVPLPRSRREELVQAGLITARARLYSEIGPPLPAGDGPPLSEVLQQMRDEDDR
ncbi:MAG: type II toxin-antitoxin system prevent-host-death family antitoxin [Thermoleophilia bacterium]|jgi:prevent-host-death family protein|nr:type II toxin-antitoxin system prevent-host-death family antitoxin [Thermoleophilia bacterium]